MFLVVVAVFLDGVVGEMHELAEVVELERLAACADVSLFVPISLERAIDAGNEHVVADVKLTVVVQKRLVYV